MKRVFATITSLCLALIGVYLWFTIPRKVDSANFTSATATLSNSRFSYKAGVATGTSGSPTVTIDGSGNGDQDTAHLFPGDEVCFTNAAESGCIGDTSYTVANVVDSTTFNLTGALGDNLDASGYVIATQSGTLAISVTTVTEIPSDGDILVTIPSINSDGKTDDGIPDTANSASVNGFDISTAGTGDVTLTADSGCTGVTWTPVSVTAGGASSDTVILFTPDGVCAAGSVLAFALDSSPGLINPAPAGSSRDRGVADSYSIDLTSRDGGDNELDTADMIVAPVEGVLVSATVDETLALTVAGIASSSSACGQTTDITTTATSVPWGTIAATDTFYEGAQQLTVSTNADGGYNVYIEENDQMGKDGNTCTDVDAGEADNCIKDTVCDATCSESSSTEWTTATNNGLGYSLANVDGTDAAFLYNDSGRTFSSRQIADVTEGGETRQSVMTNAGQVSSKDIYVCYRLSISGTQPAGYYYNTVKYTAVASF